MGNFFLLLYKFSEARFLVILLFTSINIIVKNIFLFLVEIIFFTKT